MEDQHIRGEMTLEDQNVLGEMTLWTGGNIMDKESKRQRELGDSGGRLLTAVKGHSVEQKRVK